MHHYLRLYWFFLNSLLLTLRFKNFWVLLDDFAPNIALIKGSYHFLSHLLLKQSLESPNYDALEYNQYSIYLMTSFHELTAGTIWYFPNLSPSYVIKEAATDLIYFQKKTSGSILSCLWAKESIQVWQACFSISQIQVLRSSFCMYMADDPLYHSLNCMKVI